MPIDWMRFSQCTLLCGVCVIVLPIGITRSDSALPFVQTVISSLLHLWTKVLLYPFLDTATLSTNICFVCSRSSCISVHGFATELCALMAWIGILYPEIVNYHIYKSIADFRWAGIDQSVQLLATGWAVWGSNPSGGEIFRTRPDLPWGPPSLLYSGYRVFLGGKAAGAWRWPPNPIHRQG